MSRIQFRPFVDRSVLRAFGRSRVAVRGQWAGISTRDHGVALAQHGNAPAPGIGTRRTGHQPGRLSRIGAKPRSLAIGVGGLEVGPLLPAGSVRVVDTVLGFHQEMRKWASAAMWVASRTNAARG